MTSPDLSGSQASERPEAAPGAQATEAPPAPGSDAGNAFWGGGDGTETARKRRWPRILIAVGVFLALIVAGLGGLVWQRQSSYNGNIDRIKGVMPDDGAKRPGPNVAGTENWLLVGSDSRAEAATTGEGNQVWKPGQQRTDTIMLLHLPADRKKAYIISFPRDSWVEIPGYGRQKINAAFSFGGPKLLIETMESLTGIRVDHFGAIDFEGFKSMTDALGGVTVNIKQSVYDPARKKQWEAGGRSSTARRRCCSSGSATTFRTATSTGSSGSRRSSARSPSRPPTAGRSPTRSSSTGSCPRSPSRSAWTRACRRATCARWR
ncbi:LCP family protein [Actinomadura madurae]|nr:LCP family protein [Actinomadura madurae]MCQ0006454.1 LCP family protein [Actinomadura madurae]